MEVKHTGLGCLRAHMPINSRSCDDFLPLGAVVIVCWSDSATDNTALNE